MKSLLFKNKEYLQLIQKIKNEVNLVQLKAVLLVNKELLRLYWNIGKAIAEKQEQSEWGDSVVEAIAHDLRKEFPQMKGFSRSNLFNMLQWYTFYAKRGEKVQQLVGQLPWGHNVAIINKIKKTEEALFYVQQSIKNNWSRNTLIHQIEQELYHRVGKITHNFIETLPPSQSDLAQQTLKDPYVFDFLCLRDKAQEKEIEKELTKHITKFLLELGAGFSFVGTQYLLEVSGKDFFIDLLFYHLKLRCYVVIELKTGEFRPEYAGKVNFYLSAIDNLIKGKHDNPSIGIILCKSKDKVIAE